MDQEAMVAFFRELAQDYKPNMLWVIYSCINSWYLLEKNFDLKHHKALRKFLKAKTKHHISTKAAVFTPKETHKMVMMYGYSKHPKLELMTVTICIVYYGLLYMNDLLEVKKRDVNYDEKEGCWKVQFNYAHKQENEGMTYLIPINYNNIIHKYYMSLTNYDKSKHQDKPYFLCNFNVKAKMQVPNAGHSNLSKFAHMMAKDLSKPHPEH